ncbi:PREDICTED: fibroblast growth factor 2-like [Nicrophorus vespilloides]|uniref:Fibroblast growth factor 2-like n=1 Tax=Nicrophorus vespilloides TaxID=110193 RepID=A0ABM1N6H7_NICVS|nr:PREDICTED: fibroblast growth factor 2-like [Nicrophorus vespilloides]
MEAFIDTHNEEGSSGSSDSPDYSSSISEDLHGRVIIGPPNPTTNPLYTNNVQLHSETGYYLMIGEDMCQGSEDKEDQYTRIVMEPISGGNLRLRGFSTNLYVAMRDDNGKIYSTADKEDQNTIFYESPAGNYSTFNKIEKPNWFLAINTAGKMKKGRNTTRNKASMFLKRPW